MTGNESAGRKNRKEKIVELRQELQQAEFVDVVEDAVGTMQTLSSGETSPRSELGPTVLTPLTVNGITTTALVDTGSPATIISLEFVIRVLVAGRKKDETPEQWKQATYDKFSRPSVTLNNYGGKPVDIMAQD